MTRFITVAEVVAKLRLADLLLGILVVDFLECLQLQCVDLCQSGVKRSLIVVKSFKLASSRLKQL